MSAIVDAMHDAVEESRFHRLVGFSASAKMIEANIGRAADAINRASNAAQASRVVRGAPRTWAVRWWSDGREGIAACVDKERMPTMVVAQRLSGLRPTWDAPNRLWIWSTAAHDPRGCEMPRAGEVRR